MKMADYDFRLVDPKDIKSHPPEIENETRRRKRQLEDTREYGRNLLQEKKRKLIEIGRLKKMSAIEQQIKDLEEETKKIDHKIKENDEKIEDAIKTINNIDTRVCANKIAIEELKKNTGGAEKIPPPGLSSYKEAVNGTATVKRLPPREDRKISPEMNYYVGRHVDSVTDIPNLMKEVDRVMNCKAKIEPEKVAKWIEDLQKMTEITPIPRHWWEEDEKWLKERKDFDKEKMRPLSIKFLVNKYMREGLGFGDEAINNLWTKEIAAIWPTLSTERMDTRPNSLIIAFKTEGYCNVFTTQARPREIAIGNQKTLRLKVRLVCPLLFRAKYNSLMKQGAAYKVARKSEVDSYWAKKQAGEDMEGIPRPFGLAYRVSYSVGDLILQTSIDLDSNGQRIWKTQMKATDGTFLKNIEIQNEVTIANNHSREYKEIEKKRFLEEWTETQKTGEKKDNLKTNLPGKEFLRHSESDDSMNISFKSLEPSFQESPQRDSERCPLPHPSQPYQELEMALDSAEVVIVDSDDSIADKDKFYEEYDDIQFYDKNDNKDDINKDDSQESVDGQENDEMEPTPCKDIHDANRTNTTSYEEGIVSQPETNDSEDQTEEINSQGQPNAKMAAMASTISHRYGPNWEEIKLSLLDYDPQGDARDAKCIVVKTGVTGQETILKVETSPLLLCTIFREFSNLEELRLESTTHNNLRLKSHTKTKNSVELKMYYVSGKTRADASVKVQLKNNIMTVTSKTNHTIQREYGVKENAAVWLWKEVLLPPIRTGLSKTGMVNDKRLVRHIGDQYNGHVCKECQKTTRNEPSKECAMCRTVIHKECMTVGGICKKKCYDAVWTVWTREEANIPETTPGTSKMMRELETSLRSFLLSKAQKARDLQTLDTIDKLPKESELNRGREREPIVTTDIDTLAQASRKSFILSNADSNINKEIYSKMPEELRKYISPRGHIKYAKRTSLLGQKPEERPIVDVGKIIPETWERTSENARREWRTMQYQLYRPGPLNHFQETLENEKIPASMGPESAMNGACLFNSLNHLTRMHGYGNRWSPERLRIEICDRIEKTEKYHMSALHMRKKGSWDNIKDYVEDMRDPTSWGDETCIQVACDMFKVNIELVDSTLTRDRKYKLFCPTTGAPDTTFHMIWCGRHYQSLITNHRIRKYTRLEFELSDSTDLMCRNYREVTIMSDREIKLFNEKEEEIIIRTKTTPMGQPAVDAIISTPKKSGDIPVVMSTPNDQGKIIRPAIVETEVAPKRGRRRKCKPKIFEQREEIDKITGGKLKRNGDFVKEGQWTVVYTDGSCRDNGQDDCKAGLGVYFGPGHYLNKGRMVEGEHQTNNAGEVQAVKLAIKIALRNRKEISHLLIRTDSMYTIKMVEQLPQKKANKWRNKNKKKMANKKDLVELYNILNQEGFYNQNNGETGIKTSMVIRFEHVRAHQDMAVSDAARGNEYADRWANAGALENEDETVISNNSNYSITNMDKTLEEEMTREIEESSVMIERIITQLIHETILRIEAREHLNKTTVATQTEYMPKAGRKDRNRLINNANKTEEVLTEEAKDTRITELSLEVAKRDEMIGGLQEKVFGLRKVLEHFERKMIETDADPKESEYLTISVDQYKLTDMRKTQEESLKVAMDNCARINRIIDYLKSFKGLSMDTDTVDEDQSTRQDVDREIDGKNDGKKSQENVDESD